MVSYSSGCSWCENHSSRYVLVTAGVDSSIWIERHCRLTSKLNVLPIGRFSLNAIFLLVWFTGFCYCRESEEPNHDQIMMITTMVIIILLMLIMVRQVDNVIWIKKFLITVTSINLIMIITIIMIIILMHHHHLLLVIHHTTAESQHNVLDRVV